MHSSLLASTTATAIILILIASPIPTTASVFRNTSYTVRPDDFDRFGLRRVTSAGVIQGRPNYAHLYQRVLPIDLNLNPQKLTRAWLGIPFAQPPVGDLRFKPPQPIPLPTTPEDHVINAVHFPPPCPQNFPTLHAKSEDCLYLNVFAPSLPKIKRLDGKLLPVMVFFYGGAYNFGDSYFFGGFNPKNLVKNKRNKVVVVTFNYRVASFGFFQSTPHLASGQDSPNLGILDQRMALQWIKQHIHHFHGDPENITLFGNSAGAQSIAVHLTSPSTPKGLFHRAIMQSPPLGIRMRKPDELFSASFTLAQRLGCTTPSNQIDMACMRRKSMQDIMHAMKPMWHNPETDKIMNKPIDPASVNGERHTQGLDDQFQFWPAYDTDLIPGDLRVAFQQGKIIPGVDIIMGTARNEAGIDTKLKDILPILKRIQRNKKYNKTAYTDLIKYLFGDRTSEQALRQFPASDDVDDNMSQVERIGTDYAMTCPTRRAALDATRYTASSNNIYVYQFDQPGFPWLGRCRSQLACHTSELPYMFRTLELFWSKKKRILQKQVMEYWTNFATTGNPNTSRSMVVDFELPKWTPYDGRSFMSLGKDIGMKQDEQRDQDCKFLLDVVGYQESLSSLSSSLQLSTWNSMASSVSQHHSFEQQQVEDDDDQEEEEDDTLDE